jgi:hypothetical protein
MSKLAAIITLVILSGTAAAQPSLTPPAQPLPPLPVQPAHEGELSENTALALSLGGTIGAYTLAAVSADKHGDNAVTLQTVAAFGTFFAPSLGHWYAHSFLTRGLGVRAAGVGVAFAGALLAFSECPLFADTHCDPTGADALVVIGAGLYVAGTIDDIVTAPGKARAYNHRTEISVVPLVRKDSGGVAIVGRF